MAKKIMIQGTMSNSGKSLLTAGLLRVFAKDGYKVAPFKSQNMALNSYVTDEGLEMGRAQAMQAMAAGVEPHVNMNPVLLKPSTDVGSQVIVNGKVVRNMSAKEYFAYKKNLIPTIKEAYSQLDKEYDIVVLEGAGSPAEINLKENDIVNMGLAEMLDAPVLLVGDIDCGGVFAQLYGTVMLLPEKERNRLQGLIVNKFRGDPSLFVNGQKQLEALCRLPVMGIMPFLDIDLEDEDSMSSRFREKPTEGKVDVVVIRLPHISNFTDFDPLEASPEINLRYVNKPQDVGNAAAIILPGTKNTMADLKWMIKNGFEEVIQEQLERGCFIVGICGGFQMLGEELFDIEGIEHGGRMDGLKLLSTYTKFSSIKTRTKVKGTIICGEGPLEKLSGAEIQGYEIHMGVTENGTSHIFTEITNQLSGRKQEGAYRDRVFGTYIHGLFDSDDFRNRFIDMLLEEHGMFGDASKKFVLQEYKEKQYDLLEQAVRKHLNMEAIYKMLK